MQNNSLSYPIYNQRSGWNALLPTRRPAPKLTADVNLDIAIVGAGYTGIAAARRLCELDPDADIALIDSSEIGEGSPGRNSGFLLEIALANDANSQQMARMTQCNRLIQGTMNGIIADVRESPSVQLKRTGTYRGVAGLHNKSLVRYREFLQAAGLPFEVLNRNDLKRRIGTDFYREGLYSPHCYLAQPAALIRTLAERLPPSIQLYENTPVTALLKQNSKWLLQTREANVSASKVILANNAFSKSFGVGKSQLVAMYTYAGLTSKLSESVLASLGSEHNWGLLPAHRLGSTLRRTEDGRLLVRSFYGYEREAEESVIRRELKLNLQRRYPQLNDFEFDKLWGGAVGYTHNGGVLWGEVEANLFVSAGCNGGGVVKGTLFGSLLADLANGKQVVDVPALFGRASWLPPEPVRGLGFKMLSSIERWRGRAEL